MKLITVIIPCHNEASAISSVVSGFPRERLASHGYSLDVLVVDNNSSDGTSSVATAAGARVVFEPKQGKGHAIRRGFSSLTAATDFVVMLDGDHTYRPQEILRLVEPLDSGFSNVILGSRMHGCISVGSMKTLNRFGNRVYSGLVRTAYHVPVTDVLTGYFAWRREVVDRLNPILTSSGFAIEMEMITKMVKLGYAIYCVPVSYDSRSGKSNLSPMRDGVRILGTFVNGLTWRPLDVKAPPSHAGLVHPTLASSAPPPASSIIRERSLSVSPDHAIGYEGYGR